MSRAWLAIGLLLAAPASPLRDIATTAGADFTLRNAAAGSKHQIETMVGGVALLDYDGDGWLDIYFTNGGSIPKLEKPGPDFHNRLYRNLGNGKFEDVTERAGVAGIGYHMGAAAVDFDNDGDPDLFVTGVRRNLLYRNRGDGTFDDWTGRSGISVKNEWSIAAGWFDFDNDGDLDLFIVNYVAWDPRSEPACGEKVRTYCHPKFYRELPNQLFRNNGDGTFSDISVISGIGAHKGKGMGVAFADYDDDGDLDVFVANDTTPNFLFRNLGGGKFEEVALRAGVAFNDDGRALSSMGVDFRDYDNDGRPDLFVTALANETFPLYRNAGGGLFSDVTYAARVGKATLALSGWGNGIFDFDNDGWKDLITANGDVNDNTEQFSSRASRQPLLLLKNLAGAGFAPVDLGLTAAMHRGAAFGDIDNDGAVDAVISRIGEPALVLRNTGAHGNGWLGLRLQGTSSNRDGIGARVRIVTPDGRGQWNHATTSVGYAGSSDVRVHFGLGAHARAKLVEVRWPSGKVQKLENVEGGRYLAVREP